MDPSSLWTIHWQSLPTFGGKWPRANFVSPSKSTCQRGSWTYSDLTFRRKFRRSKSTPRRLEQPARWIWLYASLSANVSTLTLSDWHLRGRRFRQDNEFCWRLVPNQPQNWSARHEGRRRLAPRSVACAYFRDSSMHLISTGFVKATSAVATSARCWSGKCLLDPHPALHLAQRQTRHKKSKVSLRLPQTSRVSRRSLDSQSQATTRPWPKLRPPR